MQTVYMCDPESFCPDCKECGGEYGIAHKFFCMATRCQTPSKTCEYIKAGGSRPVFDGMTIADLTEWESHHNELGV